MDKYLSISHPGLMDRFEVQACDGYLGAYASQTGLRRVGAYSRYRFEMHRHLPISHPGSRWVALLGILGLGWQAWVGTGLGWVVLVWLGLHMPVHKAKKYTHTIP